MARGRAGGAYTVEEGPDADGNVQQHRAQVPGLHQVQQPREAQHGLQGHQAVRVITVVQPTDHGRQELGAMGPYLGMPHTPVCPGHAVEWPSPPPSRCHLHAHAHRLYRVHLGLLTGCSSAVSLPGTGPQRAWPAPHLIRGARGNVGQAPEHQPSHTGARVLLPCQQVVQQGLQEHQVVHHVAAKQLGAEVL